MNEKSIHSKNLKNLNVYIKVGKEQLAICKLDLQEIIDIENITSNIDIVIDDKIFKSNLSSVAIKTKSEKYPHGLTVHQTEHSAKVGSPYSNFNQLDLNPSDPAVYSSPDFIMVTEQGDQVKNPRGYLKENIKFLVSKNYEVSTPTYGKSSNEKTNRPRRAQ